jgi:acyl CoA:acetate/3-ketoacid CoA transferase beta subunit
MRRIYTNLAVIDGTRQGLFVTEMIPGMTLEKLHTLTEPQPQLASHWQALGAARGPRGPCRVKNPAISPERA